MILDIYQADAFTDKVFGGNPAAIIPLVEWLPDQLMQQIASENNLSETAFLVKEGEYYRIRWFTPAVEVDLCGHATLAAAHVLIMNLGFKGPQIKFISRSGELFVDLVNELLVLNFPAIDITNETVPQDLIDGFNIEPQEVYKANEDYFFVFKNEKEIADLDPDFGQLKKTKSRGIICTAKGDQVDFVSRFFAPAAGIDEDPVTGSAHTKLIPYWSKRLEKTKMVAWQISSRKGELFCTHLGDRVLIAGKAVSYLEGKISV